MTDVQDRLAPTPGRLFVISAPSGAGKSTLCGHLRKRYPKLAYSVSHTTRAPRPGEIDGMDYWFISPKEFEAGIAGHRWAEWAKVHDAYYGTAADGLADALAAGQNVLLDIDVQGARQIRDRFPRAVTIFIKPPSLEELARRLKKRQTDSAEAVARRMANARDEMAAMDEYDFTVLNDQLSDAIDALATIVASAIHLPVQGEE